MLYNLLATNSQAIEPRKLENPDNRASRQPHCVLYLSQVVHYLSVPCHYSNQSGGCQRI